jgi:hypothetical protein
MANGEWRMADGGWRGTETAAAAAAAVASRRLSELLGRVLFFWIVAGFTRRTPADLDLWIFE